MQIDSTASLILWVVVLASARQGSALNLMNHETYRATLSDPCLQYESYKYLYDLSVHVDRCVSVNSMWHYLADLRHDCRRQIMDHMNAVFQGPEASVNCVCTGHDSHHNIIRLQNLDQDFCNRMYAPYRFLHDEIYAHSPSPCRSHQYLWRRLFQIHVPHNEKDCRTDLIFHAAATYPNPRHDPCSCTQVATPSTSTRAPSTTIHSPTTRKTTEMLIGLHTCNKALTIVEIAHNATLAHTNASDCIPGDHKSSEALVFASCYTSSTETWSKGENVMSVCSRIPLFTPIATFRPDGVYTSNGGTAGIFLGCIPNGFKFAVQDCHSGVQIKHLLTGGAFTNDPSTYFVIRW